MYTCSIVTPFHISNIYQNTSRIDYSSCGKPATKFYRTDIFISKRNLTFPVHIDVSKGYIARCQDHEMPLGTDQLITEISEENYSVAHILIS